MSAPYSSASPSRLLILALMSPLLCEVSRVDAKLALLKCSKFLARELRTSCGRGRFILSSAPKQTLAQQNATRGFVHPTIAPRWIRPHYSSSVAQALQEKTRWTHNVQRASWFRIHWPPGGCPYPSPAHHEKIDLNVMFDSVLTYLKGQKKKLRASPPGGSGCGERSKLDKI